MKLSSFLHFASFGVKTILFRKKEPILGTVIVTDKCNLRCKHCSVNNITAVVHPYDIRAEVGGSKPFSRFWLWLLYYNQ